MPEHYGPPEGLSIGVTSPFHSKCPNTDGALAYNLEPMKQELVNGLIGRHYPLKPHHRAMMGCSGFLIVVAAFCLYTGLFSNRHYLAFGLVVIPSVLIMAVGARLIRSAITYPSAEGKTTVPSQS